MPGQDEAAAGTEPGSFFFGVVATIISAATADAILFLDLDDRVASPEERRKPRAGNEGSSSLDTFTRFQAGATVVLGCVTSAGRILRLCFDAAFRFPTSDPPSEGKASL